MRKLSEKTTGRTTILDVLFCFANHERAGQITVYLWVDYRRGRAVALVRIWKRLAGQIARGHSLLRQRKLHFSFPYRDVRAYQCHSDHSPLAVPEMSSADSQPFASCLRRHRLEGSSCDIE